MILAAFPPPTLLLSLDPRRHARAILGLRRLGVRVHVADCPGRALTMLDRSPALVLVDLAHGPAVDERVVVRLNRLRGALQVVAIHDGDLLRHAAIVDQLHVDGFCRTHDLTPVAELGGGPCPATGSGPPHRARSEDSPRQARSTPAPRC
jgi:hypothetical protein